MKAILKHCVGSFSGTLKNQSITYLHIPGKNITYAREYSPQTLTDNNHRMGAIAKNLTKLLSHLSPEYRSQLTIYARLLDQLPSHAQKCHSSAHALFTKLMWSVWKVHPDFPLEEIDYEHLMNLDLPIHTICDAMKSGFLEMIPQALCLDAKM